MSYDAPFCSLVISTLALISSFVTLWKTHLSKCRPHFATGDLSLRIFPITNENKTEWFIPSIMIPLSISNSGAQQGLVNNLRLSLHYSNLSITDNRETILAVWEIPPSDCEKIDKNRFSWIDEIVVGKWMPYTILSKSTITKCWIFETRWDHPVIHDDIIVTLEVQINQKWLQASMWKINLKDTTWSFLTQNGAGLSFLSNHDDRMPNTTPPDLHRYTRPHDFSPVKFELGTSYLSFPGDDKND